MATIAAPAVVSRASVRDALLVALTFSSGAVDAVSFVALGKVFTAFETGNVVFLGLGLAGAGGPNELRVLLSLLMFAAGVALATRIVAAFAPAKPWPPGVTAALLAAVGAQAAFAALWIGSGAEPSTPLGDVLVSLWALSMGLQSRAVLALGVPGVFTTAATATVIFLAKDLAGPSQPGTEPWRLATVLLALLAGAAAGGLLLMHARSVAPVLPFAITAVVVAVAARTHLNHFPLDKEPLDA
jgi:uncharacterized membrane protein YoaK (UPF0700 family)